MGENQIQRNVRLAVGARPTQAILWRNSVGVAKHGDTTVRYGLCPGSSDLIGLAVVEITPEHVGRTIARFVALEVKAPKGRVRPDQTMFLDLVNARGGYGAIVRSPEEALQALEQARL